MEFWNVASFLSEINSGHRQSHFAASGNRFDKTVDELSNPKQQAALRVNASHFPTKFEGIDPFLAFL